MMDPQLVFLGVCAGAIIVTLLAMAVAWGIEVYLDSDLHWHRLQMAKARRRAARRRLGA